MLSTLRPNPSTPVAQLVRVSNWHSEDQCLSLGNFLIFLGTYSHCAQGLLNHVKLDKQRTKYCLLVIILAIF